MLAATTCAGLQWQQAASCLTSLPSSTPQPKGSSALHTATFTSPRCWLPQGDVENAKKCFKNAIKCSPQHLEVSGWAGQQCRIGVGGVKIDRRTVCRPPVCLPAHCQGFPHAALVLTRLWPTPLYSPQAHFNMGNLYRQCAEFGRAIQRCAWLAGWQL